MGSSQSRSSSERRSHGLSPEARPQNSVPTAPNQHPPNQAPRNRVEPNTLTNGRSNSSHQTVHPPNNYPPLPSQSSLTGPQRLLHTPNGQITYMRNQMQPGHYARYTSATNQPQPQPQPQQQAPQPQISLPSLPPKSVNNNVFLVKESLQLVQDEKDRSVWKIEFDYRSTRAAVVDIFFVANELDGVLADGPTTSQKRKRHRQIITQAESPPGTRSRLKQSLKGHFMQETDAGLVPERYRPPDLSQEKKEHHERYKSIKYPLIIRLVTVSDPPSAKSEDGEKDRDDESNHQSAGEAREEPGYEKIGDMEDQSKIWETLDRDHSLGGELTVNIQCQTTYAEFHRESDQSDWEIRVLKQKVWVAEIEYVLKEIYGEIVQGVADDGSADELGDGSACVVCLSETRTFACFPCNHLCLCKECAGALSSQTNKCPLCRAPVKQLLDISSSAKSMKRPVTQDIVKQDSASSSHVQASTDVDQATSSEEIAESSGLPNSSADDEGAVEGIGSHGFRSEDGGAASQSNDDDFSTIENDEAAGAEAEVVMNLRSPTAENEQESMIESAVPDEDHHTTGLETKTSENSRSSASEESEIGFIQNGDISDPASISERMSSVNDPNTEGQLNDSSSGDSASTSNVNGENCIKATKFGNFSY